MGGTCSSHRDYGKAEKVLVRITEGKKLLRIYRDVRD
jgi:hypothetical protein